MTPKPCRYCRRSPVVMHAPQTVVRCEHPGCPMQPAVAATDGAIEAWNHRHGGACADS